MAAVRLPGPCARRAPSSGHSAGGGGTSRGPQHALHSVRWPRWGSLRGPSWAWTTSGGRGRARSPAAPRAGKPALSGWAAAGRADTPGRSCPTPPALNEVWGPRASHTHLRWDPTPWMLDPLRVRCAIQWTGLRFTEGRLLPWDWTFFRISDGLFSLAWRKQVGSLAFEATGLVKPKDVKWCCQWASTRSLKTRL